MNQINRNKITHSDSYFDTKEECELFKGCTDR